MRNMAHCEVERPEQFNIYKIIPSLTLFRTGPQTHRQFQLETCSYSAKFVLDHEISGLFPHINATIEDAEYFKNPEYIKFTYKDHLCILHPKEGLFTPIENKSEAIDYLQLLLEFISSLELHGREIEPDFRRNEPVSPLDIYSLLPGSNCKKCGYNTCLAYAAALSRQYTSLTKCSFLAAPVEEKSIFRVVDSNGQYQRTVSIAINTDCMRREVRRKEANIQTLQDKLAELEQTSDNDFFNTNSKLLSPLTNREIDVLREVTQGATNKEISKKLYISEHTVKTHVTHIFDKLGVNDRTQASVWAAQNGLLYTTFPISYNHRK